MAISSWSKRLRNLLPSAGSLAGRKAKAVVGATISIAALPSTEPPTAPISPQTPTTEVLSSQAPKRYIRGFILARGPHKTVNPGKPVQTAPATAAPNTTPQPATGATSAGPTTVKPVAPPRPAGG